MHNICLSAANLAEIKPPSPPRKQISQVVICLPTQTPERWYIYIIIYIHCLNPNGAQRGPYFGKASVLRGFKNRGHEGAMCKSHGF